MLASAHMLCQPTTLCPSILGRELRFRFRLSAECPKGSNSMCIGFDNRLSRSSTLVNLQDVNYLSEGSLYTKSGNQESGGRGM